ncbi:MAG: hypothetical protein HYV27_16880 [Candidatus Hydrogenedentes bacterium]|nr:hypothetical protein [Candidatus Hydrogenedentota bacterium]
MKTSIRLLALSFLYLVGSIQALNAAEVTIEPDRMLKVNGQRTFVLGLYHYPETPEVLKEVAGAGFNLIYATPDQAKLDALSAHGIYSWLNLGGTIDLSEQVEARTTDLTAFVNQWKQHPSLMVWEVPDEALWNTWYQSNLWRHAQEPHDLRAAIDALPEGEQRTAADATLKEIRVLQRDGRLVEAEDKADGLWQFLGQTPPHADWRESTAAVRARTQADGMVAGYQLLKTLDSHPVWMNHAPRNSIPQLGNHNRAADIVGCDIYPVPQTAQRRHSDLVDQSVSSVGAYTDRMQAAAPGKPVFMVLQGTGWGDFGEHSPEEEASKDFRRPTLEETRFMAFDALVHGARGVLYWGTQFVETDSTFWKELLQVIKELSDLQPVISAPDVATAPEIVLDETLGSIDRSVLVLGKDTGNGQWFVLVNEWPGPLTVNLRPAGVPDGTAFRELYSGQTVTVQGGALRNTIRGFGVQVYGPAS